MPWLAVLFVSMIFHKLQLFPLTVAFTVMSFVASVQAEEKTEFSVPLRQTSPSPADAPAWRFVTGIPIPRGALADVKHVKLVDANGNEVPSEFEALAYWSPKRDSIKWLRLIFTAPTMIVQAPKYQLVFGRGVKSARIANPIKIDEDATSLSVTTGPLHFTLDKKRGSILSSVNRFGRRVYTADKSDGPYVEDDTGAIYRAAFEPRAQVTVEESGPVRAVVRVESWHVRDLSSGTTPFSPAGVRLNKSITRYYAYAGLPCIEVDWTFVITADTDLVRFKDIGLRLSGSREAQFGLDRDKDIDYAYGYLLQKTPDEFVVRQLRGKTYADLATGTKGPGWFATKNLAVTMRDFWQTFPRELEINQSSLIVHAWPGHGETLDKTPMGISRTQQLLLDFSGESTDRIEARRALFLARPHVWIKYPQWLAESGALGPMDVTAAESWDDAGIKNWEALDRAGYYGIWNWGGMPESIQKPDSPAFGCLDMHWLLYACTGRAAHLRYARANTHYWRDVGIAHYSTPASEKRNDGGSARSPTFYPQPTGPKSTDESGVFPLLLDYYMTGDRRSLKSAELYVDSVIQHSSFDANMRSLLDWYAHSWEAELGKKIDDAVHELIAKDSTAAKSTETGLNGTNFLSEYLWLTRYEDVPLQHRKNVAAFVKKHARSDNLRAAAWFETGDAKYVQTFLCGVLRAQLPRERWLTPPTPEFGNGAQKAVCLDDVLYSYAAWRDALTKIKVPATEAELPGTQK